MENPYTELLTDLSALYKKIGDISIELTAEDICTQRAYDLLGKVEFELRKAQRYYLSEE